MKAAEDCGSLHPRISSNNRPHSCTLLLHVPMDFHIQSHIRKERHDDKNL